MLLPLLVLHVIVDISTSETLSEKSVLQRKERKRLF